MAQRIRLGAQKLCEFKHASVVMKAVVVFKRENRVLSQKMHHLLMNIVCGSSQNASFLIVRETYSMTA